MTAARWLGVRAAAILALNSALSLGAVGLIELVERARGSGGLAALLALVGWRLPLLLRELLPALAAVSAAAAVAGLRRRGELLGLAAAGIGPGRVTAALALALGAAGGLGAAGLELVAPQALDRAAEAEALLEGRSLSVDGRWAVTGAGLLRVGGAGRDTLEQVTLVRREGGRLVERWDAEALRWDGARWLAVGGRVYRFEPALAASDLAGQPVEALRLPPPAELGALLHRQAASELGLLELAARPGEASRSWWWWRLAGLVTPLVFAAAAAALTLRTPAGPALAVAVAAAVGAALTLLGLALTGAAPPGVAPAVAAGVAALALLASPLLAPRYSTTR